MRIPCLLTLLVVLSGVASSVQGMVAGGRPNAISGGHNAFAGVVNPANAVWVSDRFDIGAFIVRQELTLNNKNNNPLFEAGKTDQTYKANYLATGDVAIHKRGQWKGFDCSLSLAAYTTPGNIKVRTKKPVSIAGTKPIRVEDKTQVISTILSLKLNDNHSIGCSLDYFYLSHLRNGFQNADNSLRSIAPGFVTNKGRDHSYGFGLSLGWRWNINPLLTFGLAFIKQSDVGHYKKYRGYEPHFAKNMIPASLGGGFTYRFNEKLAGRFEVLWTHLGALPNANNTVFSDGTLNTNKRGSNKSPGTGLQDSTVINLGLGYKANERLSIGSGFSHRVRLARKSPYIISHSYRRQVTYDLATLGINYNYHHHDFFLTLSHGFDNLQKGEMPMQFGGGKFSSQKEFNALSMAWGYLY